MIVLVLTRQRMHRHLGESQLHGIYRVTDRARKGLDMVRKHPEVVALAVLTLLSMAAAWRPLPGLQISSGFREPVSVERFAAWPELPRLKQLTMESLRAW